MKPKYEIDEKVYLKDKEVTIKGVQKDIVGDYVYSLFSNNWTNDNWFYESRLSPTPPDDKKYYILYRSKDGLEKSVKCEKMEYSKMPKFLYLLWDKRTCGIPTCTICAKDSREYGFIKEELRDDGKTVLYIYEEI
jgi:hypothetical protein